MGRHCFCAKPPAGDNVQAVSSNARQFTEKHCRQPSAQLATESLTTAGVSFSCSVGMRSHSAGEGTSQEAAATGYYQKEGVAAASSESYTLPNFRQESREALPRNNPSSVASQQQGKQQSVLQVAPMAFRFPTYGEHFRYELSKFRTFWTCDLHYRDWRQVFAASPFPNAMPPNRVFTVRAVLCLSIFVAEVVAVTHTYWHFGWPMLLYFTSTYCFLVSVFWILLTAISFHALRTWKEPLYAKPTSSAGSLRWDKSITTATRGQIVTSASTTGHASEICCDAFSTHENRASSTTCREAHFLWPTTVQAQDSTKDVPREHPLLSFLTAGMKKALTTVKKIWRMQGYKDLLVDRCFCVKGIIFAPNPTCPAPAREKMAASCNCGSSCKCPEVTDQILKGVYQVRQPFVSALWILHSLQLMGSTIVFIVFFSSMRANGTSFTDAWYTVWRHLVLIVITVLHSVLLTRIPFPLCHVVFAYVVWVLYFIVQMFVFALSLSNGEGDRGCVYRVFTLRKPLQFIAYGFGSLALIAGVTVSWWSLLRQRSVDVDPPPSASVPAAQVMEKQESADGGDAEQQLKVKQQSCLGARLLRFWGKGKMHTQNRSAKAACSGGSSEGGPTGL